MQRALIISISFALASACETGAIYGGPQEDGGTGGGLGFGGGAGGGVGGDLPCDVANLISTHCASCHGASLSGGAPVSLVTRADLAADSPIYPGQTEAQRSLVRMQQAVAAMPPAPASGVPANEVTAFSAWINSGMPAGSCNTGTGGGGGGGVGGGGGGGGPSDSGVDGLPCDVATLVQAKCTTCHGSPTSGGAPYSLTSLADFTQAAPGYPGQTVADRSLARMQSTTAPMPPSPNSPATAAEISTFQTWVSGGTPAGSCGSIDGGSGGPYPTTCASGSYWTGGNNGSERMNPGLPCVSCHQQQQPENAFYFMGTVFPAPHEKDLCNAPPPVGGTVEIYDANGNLALTLTPNSVGNFSSQSYTAGIALPYTARVVANGMTRAMIGGQTSGDCNTCHTEQGANGAPGRIYWP